MSDKHDFNGFDHPSLNYKNPKSLQIFNSAIALAASTLLVLGLWTILWFAVATLAKKEVSALVGGTDAQAYGLSFENMNLSGFPGRIVLTYDKPQYKSMPPAKIIWNGEKATITIKPWMPWQGMVSLGGETYLSVGIGKNDYNLNGNIEKLDMLINPGRLMFDKINIEITKLSLSGRVTSEGVTTRETAVLSADEININTKAKPGAQSNDVALTISATSKNMVLPWADGAPISNRIGFGEAAFRVSGPIAINDKIKTIFESWRDSGGKIFIDNLTVHGEPLALSGAGNIFLDQNMQPSGRMSAKITGLLPTINRFREFGLIRDADAVVAKMTLAALSQKTSDGRSFLNLGIEIKDSVLYLGPIGIGDLPQINWEYE